MQAYNNALSQYQQGSDGLKNYIKGKGEDFRSKAQAKIADALEIRSEDKEAMENTLSTVAFAAPIAFSGGQKLLSKAKTTFTGLTQKNSESSTPAGADGIDTGGATEKTKDITGGKKEEGGEEDESKSAGGGTRASLPEEGGGGGGTIASLPEEGGGGSSAAKAADDLGVDYDDITGDDEPEESGQLFEVGEGPQARTGYDVSRVNDQELLDDEPVDTGSSYMAPAQGDPYSGDIIGGEGAHTSAVDDAFGPDVGGFEDKGFSGSGAAYDPSRGVPRGGTPDPGEDEVGESVEKGAEKGAEEDAEDIAEEDDPEIGAGVAALQVGEDLAEGKNVLSSLGSAAMSLGAAGAATAVLGAEVAVPAMAAYAVGDSLYNLFTGKYKDHDDAPTQVEYSTSGITDTFTKGGFAAASMDGVTTTVSSNSAF